MAMLLRIEPRDPLIFRDGRPFGRNAGNRMRSLDFPLPGTMAGMVRTLLGRNPDGTFNPARIGDLRQVECHGPLMESNGTLFVPGAADTFCDGSGNLVRLAPDENAPPCCDLPPGLWPVSYGDGLQVAKPVPPPAWWSINRMEQWLLDPEGAGQGFLANQGEFRCFPCKDERIHVSIDPQTLASEPSMLFSTTGLVLDQIPDPTSAGQESGLLLRIRVGQAGGLPDLAANLPCSVPVGGERRFARLTSAAGQASPFEAPQAVKDCLLAVHRGDRLRMVLATPGIFDAGWRPGWLSMDNFRVGTPPGSGACPIQLRLVGVANQRWAPVSGWSHESNGPKAVRRMVPAGSVYFFLVDSPGPVDVSGLWMESVCDQLQDRRDGYGLAMWGRW